MKTLDTAICNWISEKAGGGGENGNKTLKPKQKSHREIAGQCVRGCVSSGN